MKTNVLFKAVWQHVQDAKYEVATLYAKPIRDDSVIVYKDSERIGTILYREDLIQLLPRCIQSPDVWLNPNDPELFNILDEWLAEQSQFSTI